MDKKTLTSEEVRELEKKLKVNPENDPWRQKIHLTPPIGRMSDPNGLFQDQGLHHLFFQYIPESVEKAAQVYWGHYSTPDFINYTYYTPALTPELEPEIDGIYTGSIEVGPNGPQAYYTGNVKYIGDYDYINTGREQNVMLAGDFDGKTFHKKKLLMKNADFPADMTLHVRDPKVIKKEDEWLMLLGARNKEDKGAVLVYTSPDGENNWEIKTILTGPKELGYMWECPNIIESEDQAYFIVSPQGIKAQGERFKNIYQAGWIAENDLKNNISLNDFHELDHGFDFYAPQIYQDEKGRNILIGWMAMPDAEYECLSKNYGWAHAMGLPRVVEIKDGWIYQNPVPELETLRESFQEYSLDGNPLQLKTPDIFEANLKIDSDEGKITFNEACEFYWSNQEATLEFIDEKASAGRTYRKTRVGEIRNLQIFVDISSIEIFINNGAYVFSTRYYPQTSNKLSLDHIKGELKIWKLKEMTFVREDNTPLF